jgi:hypothetical protein
MLKDCCICGNAYLPSAHQAHCPVCATLSIRINGQTYTYPQLHAIGRAAQSNLAYSVKR